MQCHRGGSGRAGLRVGLLAKQRRTQSRDHDEEGIAAGASGMTPATFPRLAEPESRAFSATAESNDYLATAFALFHEVSSQLAEESGIDVGFRDEEVLWLAFTASEAATLRSSSVGVWLDGDGARGRVTPRRRGCR